MRKAKSSTKEFEKTLAGRPPKYVIRLFVTGMTPNSRHAIQNMKRICKEDLKGARDLEIVDLYKTHA